MTRQYVIVTRMLETDVKWAWIALGSTLNDENVSSAVAETTCGDETVRHSYTDVSRDMHVGD